MKRSLAFLFVGLAAQLGAQTPTVRASNDSIRPDSAIVLAVERLALRAALDWGTFNPPKKIVIHPNVVLQGMVPDIKASEQRLPWRNEALVAFFGATSKVRDSIVVCGGPAVTCSMSDADVFATLSEPRINGRVAAVTVSLERKTQRGVQLVPLVVDMAGDGTTWVVSRVRLVGEH
jgi:hypothetical protein